MGAAVDKYGIIGKEPWYEIEVQQADTIKYSQYSVLKLDSLCDSDRWI